MKTIIHALISTGLVFTLAACGGGGGGCKLSLGGLSCKSDSTPNVAPVASAGPEQSVTVDTEVTLNGTASQDANLDPLTYAWQLTSKPTGSAATLSSTTAPKPVFTADKAGDYAFSLTVSDGQASSTSTTTVTATAANLVPVANAGTFQNVLVGKAVTLDASKSTDGNNDLLSYAWTLTGPAGSGARLDNDSYPRPQFTPDVAGTYIASLFVRDGKSTSAMAVTRIEASSDNLPPVALTGADQKVTMGSRVVLDGSTSFDPNSDLLTYSWKFIYKPPTSALREVDAPRAAITTFTPDVVGDYVLGLSVSDPKGSSSTVNTTVNVALGNLPPEAKVKESLISGKPGESISLDGSSSNDPNADRITYEWSVVSAPAGSAIQTLPNRFSAITSFTPDLIGSYVLSLRVKDATLTSEAVNVVVNVSNLNLAPVAVTGADQFTTINQSVMLDGAASSDPNGDLLTYTWSVVSLPPNSNIKAPTSNGLAGVNMPRPSFTPDVEGIYVFGLVVSDGKVSSSMAYARVTASATNSPPSAVARAATSVTTGSVVTLDGSASSDANNDPLSYTWSVLSWPGQSAPTLSLVNPKQPTFTASTAGTYVFGLTVNDGKVSSTLQTVSVTASSNNLAPTAFAGPDRSIATGSSVVIDGTGSTDANGDRLTYTWVVRSKPAGSTSSLFIEPGAGGKASFVADKAGSYVVSLVVNDGLLSSNMSVVTITAGPVDPTAPIADAGDNIAASVGSNVILNGLGSSDPSGAVLTYLWSLEPNASGAIPNATARLYSTTAPKPAFMADAAGVYVISLRVSNGTTISEKSFVTVTVN